MRTIYIQCAMGAAGDMLTAALLELSDKPEDFLRKINSCGLPGVTVSREKRVRCGITGTGIEVLVNGDVEGGHGHHHGHGHSHGIEDIRRLVSGLDVPDQVKADVLAVYTLIAGAESAVHGVTVDNIHFHELGTMDALADILGVCLLMEQLSPERVVVSPINVGSGQVRCAHGILPVPAPATARLLMGIPCYSGKIESELCTPTGAALLKHFADDFGAMPELVTEKIGYGMGSRDFESAANCVRVFLGSEVMANSAATDKIALLSCNLDDMTGEALAFASEILMEAGALDVTIIPAMMKKGRPGHILELMCRPMEAGEFAELIFKYTSTLGIRKSLTSRYTLERDIDTISTKYGDVRVKTAEGHGILRAKPEYEDLARIARKNNITLEDAKKALD